MCERKAVTPDISTTYWYLWKPIVTFLLFWKYRLTTRFLSFLILQSLGCSRLGLGEILSTLWRLQPVSVITWISIISWVTITRAQIWRYTPFTLTSTENFLSVYFRSSLQHNYKGFVCRWIIIIIIIIITRPKPAYSRQGLAGSRARMRMKWVPFWCS